MKTIEISVIEKYISELEQEIGLIRYRIENHTGNEFPYDWFVSEENTLEEVVEDLKAIISN